MLQLLTLCLLLLGATPAWATVFYVSRGEGGTPLGSNANSCTAAQNINTPKLTIGNLFSPDTPSAGGLSCLAAPGDIVYVRQGTYPNDVDANTGRTPIAAGTSFNSGQFTMVSNYQNEVVWIKPNGPNTYTGGIFAISNSTTKYFVVNGINMDGVNIDTDANTGGAFGAGPTTSHIRYQNFEAKNLYGMGGQTAVGSDDIQFINLTIHDGGTRCHNPSIPAQNYCTNGGHGYYLSGTNGLVDGGTVYNYGQYGVHVYSSVETHTNGTVVRNGVYHNNNLNNRGGAGILLSYGSNLSAYNNTCYSSGNTEQGIETQHASNVNIYNNVVYNQPGYGIVAWLGVTNVNIFNNTVNGNSAGIVIGDGSAATNTVVRNNLVTNNNTAFVNTGSGSGTTVFSNNFCTTAATGCMTAAGSFGNPLYVSPSTFNFRLQAASPAIDKGTNLVNPPVTTDFDGVSRPQPPVGGSYDVGAFEVTGTPNPCNP